MISAYATHRAAVHRRQHQHRAPLGRVQQVHGPQAPLLLVGCQHLRCSHESHTSTGQQQTDKTTQHVSPGGVWCGARRRSGGTEERRSHRASCWLSQAGSGGHHDGVWTGGGGGGGGGGLHARWLHAGGRVLKRWHLAQGRGVVSCAQHALHPAEQRLGLRAHLRDDSHGHTRVIARG